jgi:hypothetical protein
MFVNTFDVPKKQWKRWSGVGQVVFNAVYSTMLDNQDLFLHPKADTIPNEHWNTVCWNAAWVAADYATNP